MLLLGPEHVLRYFEKSWDHVQAPNRAFQPSWLTEFGKWLRFDPERQLMYCEACRYYAKPGLGVGSNNFRQSTLRDHCQPHSNVCANYNNWQTAMRLKRLAAMSEATKEEVECKKVATQMLCVYSTLLKEASISTYAHDMTLLELCGAPTVSSVKRNDDAGWVYAEVINIALADELVQALRLSPSVSVVVDEASLCDNTEWLSVSFLYIKGKPVFVRCIPSKHF